MREYSALNRLLTAQKQHKTLASNKGLFRQFISLLLCVKRMHYPRATCMTHPTKSGGFTMPIYCPMEYPASNHGSWSTPIRKYSLTEIIRGRIDSAFTFTYSALGQRTDPATFVRTCQIVLPAVIYSVLRSEPPKQQFVTMSSGTFIIPRSSPSGEIT